MKTFSIATNVAQLSCRTSEWLLRPDTMNFIEAVKAAAAGKNIGCSYGDSQEISMVIAVRPDNKNNPNKGSLKLLALWDASSPTIYKIRIEDVLREDWRELTNNDTSQKQ